MVLLHTQVVHKKPCPVASFPHLGSLILVHKIIWLICLIYFNLIFLAPAIERLADGSFSPIAGTNSVKFSQKIQLNSVHVPKLSCNLLSVSKISKDSNCHVVFCDSHCEFQDENWGMMIGSARMFGGLYYFDDNALCNRQTHGLSGSTSSIHVCEKIMVWHCRLEECHWIISWNLYFH